MCHGHGTLLTHSIGTRHTDTNSHVPLGHTDTNSHAPLGHTDTNSHVPLGHTDTNSHVPSLPRTTKRTHDTRYTLVSDGREFGSENLLAMPDGVTNADDQIESKRKVKSQNASDTRSVC